MKSIIRGGACCELDCFEIGANHSLPGLFSRILSPFWWPIALGPGRFLGSSRLDSAAVDPFRCDRHKQRLLFPPAARGVARDAISVFPTSIFHGSRPLFHGGAPTRCSNTISVITAADQRNGSFGARHRDAAGRAQRCLDDDGITLEPRDPQMT